MGDMRNIIFFDTETTGNTEQDFLCQVAYKTGQETFTGMYKPPVRIPPEASAVHHISNKMIADKIPFRESPDFQKIKNLFEREDSVIVAHNASFDTAMMKKEGIVPAHVICTLRLARHLDPEGKIGKYNLQFLRYFLDIEVDAIAHSALGDVMVLEKLFERLKGKMMTDTSQGVVDEERVIKDMIEISSHPSLLTVFNFGKHTGKRVDEVARTDRGYLEWLLAQKLSSGQMEEDWIYTLNHYLGK